MSSQTANKVDRDALIAKLESRQAEMDAWVRKQVIENDRVDILAKEVLGLEVTPMHMNMMLYEMRHKESLHLVFRGAGKTKILTINYLIYKMLKNPNIRILVASKTQGYSISILREIKQHMVENEKFIRIFGDLVGSKWDEAEITLSTRTKAMKEPTVFCAGVGGQLVGNHFDLAILDDIVDEDNSRTPHMRERTKVWYYKVLEPTMEPGSERHVIGTRYHFEDIYGHLSQNDMNGATQVVPALDEHGRSPWPEKFPPEVFHEKRKRMGLIIYNSQYLCNTEAMKGEIFKYDWMHEVEASDVPAEGRIFFGVDLAIGQKEENDFFAVCAIKVTPNGHVYVIDSYQAHLRFNDQTRKILSWWRTGIDGWTAPPMSAQSELIEVAIETVAYQDSQAQNLVDDEPTIRLRPIKTIKDKTTRAHKKSALFEQGKVHIVKGQFAFIETMVLFPNGRKDLFDAFDLATDAANLKRRHRERSKRGKVGVL